jgi:hypothetical protein
MVIKSNKGLGTLVLPSVLDISGWVEICSGDMICGDGTSGFSGPVISSSCIGSPFLAIGFSTGILEISMRSGSFCNWSMILYAPSNKRNPLLCAYVVSTAMISSWILRAS